MDFTFFCGWYGIVATTIWSYVLNLASQEHRSAFQVLLPFLKVLSENGGRIEVAVDVRNQVSLLVKDDVINVQVCRKWNQLFAQKRSLKFTELTAQTEDKNRHETSLRMRQHLETPYFGMNVRLATLRTSRVCRLTRLANFSCTLFPIKEPVQRLGTWSLWTYRASVRRVTSEQRKTVRDLKKITKNEDRETPRKDTQ